jgi:hypothetical protein
VKLIIRGETLAWSPDGEELIVIHLAKGHPLPEGYNDERAVPRTAIGISMALGIPYPSVARLLKEMTEPGGYLEKYKYSYHGRHTKGPGREVYVLSYLGQRAAGMLAEVSARAR